MRKTNYLFVGLKGWYFKKEFNQINYLFDSFLIIEFTVTSNIITIIASKVSCSLNHFEICFRKKYEFSMITPTELQELTLFLRLFVQFRKKEDE